MAAPLRVLAVGSVYPPHHLGGYEIIWRGAMRHLRRQGHLARILATDYRRPEAGPAPPEDPDVHRELDWYWRDHEWRSLGPLATLRLERHNADVLDRHLREFRPDVITWWPVGGLSLGLIERARRAGVPALFFVLDPWLSYGPERDLWNRMWAGLGPAATLADRVTGLPTRVDYRAAGRWVFCSQAMREQTLAAGLRGADDVVLSPGVESAFLDAPREAEPPPWRWRLLYLGRVVEQKGVATAIESLALLPTQATLRILGEGDRGYRRELEALASRLGVREQVSFEAPRPRHELFEVYRAADVVVFPVEWPEPWGLVPLEAMALGRPVVATGRGGSGEYLVDGENALLYPAGDVARLAAALRALAEDAALRERLRGQGYETAARHGEDAFNRSALTAMLAAAGRL
ncbi:MAG TPA: glycosyltransferase [Solirubrobacteraceae bacterium]|nr:glycosyltransferase [Solirubrobacteraceae bacterium]